jgi:hypothetical protein
VVLSEIENDFEEKELFTNFEEDLSIEGLDLPNEDTRLTFPSQNIEAGEFSRLSSYIENQAL